MDPASIVASVRGTVYLSGAAGTGKTTLAVRRLFHLIEAGVSPEQILILVPHRAMATPYYEAVSSPDLPPGTQVDIATIGGLARRALHLLWPVIAGEAGFADPSLRPWFLTLETAQYHMGQVIQPFLAAGAFDGITITRARLISQIIDNLNKSAAIGFPLEEISMRLRRAWIGATARLPVFEQVQAVAIAFRSYCLAHNLLDWSLQIQIMSHNLTRLPLFRRYLLSGYRHLIVDNAEEDIPATHDLLRSWLRLTESALVICDTDGGHRIFLGADPEGAHTLSTLCQHRVTLRRSWAASAEVAALGKQLASHPVRASRAELQQARQALVLPPQAIRFHPQMLDWVASEVGRLTSSDGLPPGEIALLAPFVSDALRFSLEDRLARLGISLQTHRPSRQLREEPAARCLITLAKLAHPEWRRPPPPEDVSQALGQAIVGLDPIRASLLVTATYRHVDGKPVLSPFSRLKPALQDRISFAVGGRYDDLWQWLEDYAALEKMRAEPCSGGLPPCPTALDHFLGRLFGEILTQAGFTFRRNLAAGAATAMLIESVRKFRLALGDRAEPETELDLGSQYVTMVEEGVIAAQYISHWQLRTTESVLLMPAYTFLMMNRPVRVQFWLDAGSPAWHERILQPLTHPYVLQRRWPAEAVWTDQDEVRARDVALARLILGLSRRCRERVYLAYSSLNERGYEQQGPLLQAVQRLLRHQCELRP